MDQERIDRLQAILELWDEEKTEELRSALVKEICAMTDGGFIRWRPHERPGAFFGEMPPLYVAARDVVLHPALRIYREDTNEMWELDGEDGWYTIGVLYSIWRQLFPDESEAKKQQLIGFFFGHMAHGGRVVQ